MSKRSGAQRFAKYCARWRRKHNWAQLIGDLKGNDAIFESLHEAFNILYDNATLNLPPPLFPTSTTKGRGE